jgi:hypothetical protein
LKLPEGASLAGDDDGLIVDVTNAQSAEAAEAELARAEAEAGITPHSDDRAGVWLRGGVKRASFGRPGGRMAARRAEAGLIRTTGRACGCAQG